MEIIEACNHLGTLEHISKTMPAGMAAAFGALQVCLEEPRTCFSCAKLGHLKKDYFAQNGAKAKVPGIYPQCHKERHFANQCRCKYDF